jgi:hypothetical protein
MNRKYITILFLLAVTGIWFAACRKDHSTLDLNKSPDVKFDTVGASSFSVYQFERIVIKPKLITSIPESDLSFTWRVNLGSGDTLFQVVSTERDLDYEMRFKPNAAGKYHLVTCTVKEKNSAIEYVMAWPVVVRNNIGEGLVVAETKDNVNTDISHIMSPEVTSAFNKVSVKHHIYSAINGTTIPGLVKQMRFARMGTNDVMQAITDNGIFRYNTLDYTYSGTNNELFFTNVTPLKPQALGGIYQGDIYIGDNRFTVTYLNVAKKFGAPYDVKFVVPKQVALNGNSGSASSLGSYEPPYKVNFYDEVNGHFVNLSDQQFGDTKMNAYASNTTTPFNPGNTPNKVNLAAGVSPDRGFLHLLKDKTTGKVELYIFDAGFEQGTTVTPPNAIAFHDLSAGPDIQNASFFVMPDNQKVIYYATSTKIYAALYGASSPVFEERYTIPAGEQISTLQMYLQSGYPLTAPFITTNNKQLVMSTWNGTEGKVYLLPMINPGLGTIDVPNIKTFDGFDKITAIAPQK